MINLDLAVRHNIVILTIDIINLVQILRNNTSLHAIAGNKAFRYSKTIHLAKGRELI